MMNSRILRIIFLILFVAFFCPFAYGKVIYVDEDAVGNNDGTSWENAYTFLQDALDDAKSAIKRIEIRVAQGVYKPKLETGYRIPGINITTSYLSRFQLINGVTLLGGYAGLTEPDPDTRDFEMYETILSGDLNGDDIDLSNPSDLFDEPTRSDNCSSIVIGSGTNRTAVLDGFIITGGRVRVHPAVIDSPTGIGGGMKNESGSPTINNCTFIGNSAEGCGGGIGNMYDSSPILTNCKFINNYGGRGGGFYNVNSNPTFINCTFTNNYADDGAGMSSSIWSFLEPTGDTVTKLIDCTFEDNNAKRSGGGLYLYKDETGLTNCAFIGNSASKGGGIYSGSGNPMLTYCQFISNSASEGGGMYNDLDTPKLSNCQFIRNNAQVTGGGLYSDYDANPLLTNCIFIDNSSNRCGGGIAGNNLIYNCIISRNTAVHNGGAIYGWGEVINCTVIGNKAGRNGGGICTQGITTLVNSIVHSNNALIGDEIYLGLRIVPAGRGGTAEGTPSVMTVSYSNVLSGEEEVSRDNDDCKLIWESGNIDIDPLFVESGYWDSNSTPDDSSDDFWIEGDYHLKSQAGRWNPASQSWIVDNVTSPCIDAGDPNSPIGHEPFPNGGIINMGAYGGTLEASKSYILSKIIYVNDDAVGNNDGTSWENAYNFLQDALADAEAAEKPIEIRVAQGVYKPNQRMPQTPGHGDNTFTLVNEVTVKGGYASFDEPDPNARKWDLYKSILSGDLNGDDIVVEDPCDMLLIESKRTDNSAVVVRANHTNETAVLDGFLITGGYFMELATGPPNGGAGMHIYQGSPTIRNCTFAGNAARKIGGGLLNRGGSNPTLINCTFTGNYAESGGGIYNTPNMPAPYMISEGSHPTLVNCTFDNNCAFKNGGGIYNFLSNPTLTDCVFRYNKVIGPYSGSTRGPHTGGGGGMYNSNSSPVLTNCLFSENSAGDGGGICSVAHSNVTLTDCTFNGNSASVRGGGLSNQEDNNLTLTNCRFIINTVTGWGGAIANDSSNTTLVNCVFSGNKAHDLLIPSTSDMTPGHGGGMSTGGNPTLINCTFIDNWASQGGGISNGGDPTLIGCTFSGNLAQNGGGMCNYSSGPELSIANCTFSGNSAELGGGIFYSFNARMKMSNCTFADNLAPDGNAIAGDPMEPSLPGYIELTNCILWDGNNAIFDPRPDSSTTVITYSDVQGGWPGEGNINVDPLFADPGYWADADDPNIAAEPNDPNAVWIDGDFHLKSQAGRWDPASQSWIRDDVTSPCIDAGDPNSPIGHEPFPNGGIINMGAYGGTAEASKSPSGLHAKYGGGAGEPNDPYLIYTAEHLNTIGTEPNDWHKHFKLMTDIDLAGYSYDQALIAPDVDTDEYYFQGNPFVGVFDGNGHTISNLTITGVSYLGLFGELGFGSTVKDLGVVDVNISGTGDVAGGLLGHSRWGATIIRCYSTGTVSGDDNIGGLVGSNGGHIKQCYNNSTVNGNYIVGGLLGANEGGAAVTNCYSTGVVNGDDAVGGLVGFNLGKLTHCYSAGVVTGSQRVGGIVGWTYGSIVSSFWDIEASDQVNMCGSQEEGASGCDDSFGKTTVEMQTAGTFLEAGWDFVDESVNGTEDIWWILEGQEYPRFLEETY